MLAFLLLLMFFIVNDDDDDDDDLDNDDNNDTQLNMFMHPQDPDAALRQNKHLDDMDKEDEDRLLKYIFVCLRAGQLEKVRHLTALLLFH